MKKIIILTLLFPIFLFGAEKKFVPQDKTKNPTDQIIVIRNEVENLKVEISQLKKSCENQEKNNDQTLNSISTQLDAATYNLTVFGILFGIAALILGIYITYIERKVVKIREENKILFDETKLVKEEVVAINNLIQKDIYGLFKKIKREETVDILNRLLEIPEDIVNLSKFLLTRKLEKNDFKILKEAYFKLEIQDNNETESDDFSFKDRYKLIFFQHFLDYSMIDEKIRTEMIDFIPTGIECTFKNDIIKSTTDFMTAIIEIGYQSMTKEINSFMNGLSESKYKNSNYVYEIILNTINNRIDQFKFFNLISDKKEIRHAKSNYGKLLTNLYSSTVLNQAENEVLERTHNILHELEQEQEQKEEEIKKAEEQKIIQNEEIKKRIEARKKGKK